jgi:putative spermidine/putrescine transport system permease protein
MKVGKLGRLTAGLFVVAVVAYYLIPMLSIAVASFTVQWGRSGLPRVVGVSGYREFWDTLEFRRSLWVSLEIAPLAVVLTLLTVVPAAYGIHMSKNRLLKSVADVFITLPLCMPPLILAVGLLQSYGGRPLILTGTVWIVVLGHVVLATPFMYRSVSANLQMIDTASLVEAARSCGAPPASILTRVIVPNLGPGIASGSLLAFTTSFGEYQLAKMVSGFMNQTFPIKIWEASKRVTRVQFGMSFIAMLLAFLFFILITYVFAKSRIREEKVIA